MKKNYYIEILNYAVRMEQKAKDFYITYKDKVKAPSTKKIFNELASMQDIHLEILQKQIEKVKEDGQFDELEVKKLVGGDEIFRLNKEEFEKDDFTDIFEDLPILKLAYSLESDFANFYQEGAEKADEQAAKKLLLELAQWKITHKDYFSEEIRLGSDNFWVENNFSAF